MYMLLLSLHACVYKSKGVYFSSFTYTCSWKPQTAGPTQSRWCVHYSRILFLLMWHFVYKCTSVCVYAYTYTFVFIQVHMGVNCTACVVCGSFCVCVAYTVLSFLLYPNFPRAVSTGSWPERHRAIVRDIWETKSRAHQPQHNICCRVSNTWGARKLEAQQKTRCSSLISLSPSWSSGAMHNVYSFTCAFIRRFIYIYICVGIQLSPILWEAGTIWSVRRQCDTPKDFMHRQIEIN